MGILPTVIQKRHKYIEETAEVGIEVSLQIPSQLDNKVQQGLQRETFGNLQMCFQQFYNFLLVVNKLCKTLNILSDF